MDDSQMNVHSCFSIKLYLKSRWCVDLGWGYNLLSLIIKFWFSHAQTASPWILLFHRRITDWLQGRHVRWCCLPAPHRPGLAGAGGQAIADVVAPARTETQSLLPSWSSSLPRAREGVILIKQFWSNAGCTKKQVQMVACPFSRVLRLQTTGTRGRLLLTGWLCGSWRPFAYTTVSLSAMEFTPSRCPLASH